MRRSMLYISSTRNNTVNDCHVHWLVFFVNTVTLWRLLFRNEITFSWEMRSPSRREFPLENPLVVRILIVVKVKTIGLLWKKLWPGHPIFNLLLLVFPRKRNPARHCRTLNTSFLLDSTGNLKITYLWILCLWRRQNFLIVIVVHQLIEYAPPDFIVLTNPQSVAFSFAPVSCFAAIPAVSETLTEFTRNTHPNLYKI